MKIKIGLFNHFISVDKIDQEIFFIYFFYTVYNFLNEYLEFDTL